MMEHKLMTFEEKGVLLSAIYEASVAGNENEAYRLKHLLPLAPGLAEIAKDMYGKEYLIENGFNLAEANKEFGDGWLDS